MVADGVNGGGGVVGGRKGVERGGSPVCIASCSS